MTGDVSKEGVAAALRHMISVEGLPGDGQAVVIEAGPQECEQLARLLGIPAVGACRATFTVTPRGKAQARVRGLVEAQVTQTCVVTLAPVEQSVREEVDLVFAPPETREEPSGEVELELQEADPPEPLQDGHIDLGAIATEHLALGLDPYPRRADAQFDQAEAGGGQEDEEPSPFAALARLKGPPQT